MANIFDVFGRLLLDDKEFQAEAVRAGEKASDNIARTTSSKLKSGLGTAAKIGFAALGAGAALVTKGLVELDDVMAQYTADTGASADETDRAKKSILALSGRNLQGIGEIAKVMAGLKTNFGLTGDAAEKTAESFLQFARVTHRDASVEVKAFDDVLDAWGKTAKDVPGIMNLLIASHQKFGTSIEGVLAVLPRMAPQLKAMNLGLDDGVALLNLFETSGIDAAAAPRILNSALAKLNGESFPDFIKRLASITDQSTRSAEAAKILGNRFGPQLANALKPGMTGLKDFNFTVDQTDGKLKEARDAIDGTFGNQVQQLIKNFGSQLLTLGDSVGPVATTIASVFSVGAALGLGKFAKVIVKGMVGVGQDAGGALAEGLQVGIGAAGTIVGNFFASRIETVVDSTKNSALGKVLKAAAAKAALLWGATFAAAGRLAEFVGALFLKLPFMPQVRAAVLASSIEMGTLAGTRTALAFKVALVAGTLLLWKEVLDVYNQQKEGIASQSEQVGRDIAASIARGNIEELKSQRAAVIDALAKTTYQGGILSVDATLKLQQNLKDLDAGIAALEAGTATAGTTAVKTAGQVDQETQAYEDQLLAMGLTQDQVDQLIDQQGDLGTAFGKGKDAVAQSADSWGVLIPKIDAGAEAWKKYRSDSAAAQKQALADQLNFSSTALSALLTFQSDVEAALGGVMTAEQDAQITKGRITILQQQLRDQKTADLNGDKKITKAEIADYKTQRTGIENELTTLKLHLALIGDDTHRVTALNALLTSKDMRDGLNSKNDNIRTAHQALRDKILGYLKDTADKGGPAAERAANIIENWLGPQGPLGNAFDWGSSIGQAYVRGIANGLRQTYGITVGIGKLAGIMRSSSPPKSPLNPLRKIDKWGEATGEAWVSPFAGALAAGVARARDALSGYAGLTAPLGGMASIGALAGAGVGSMAAAVPSGSSTDASVTINGGIHLHDVGSDVSPERAGTFANKVLDEVAKGLRDQRKRYVTG